jgi:hypothetical protein
VNAAILLVTTTWLAAAEPAPAKPAPAVAPAASSCQSGCSNSCCDEGCGHHFLDRLKGLFHHDDCCDSCGQSACNSCDSGCGHKFFAGFNRGCGCDSCDTGCGHSLFSRWKSGCGDCGGCSNSGHNSCGGCGDACCGESTFDRLRGKFHGLFHHDDCCDTCNSCNSCGGAAAPAKLTPPPADGGKKPMPSAPEKSGSKASLTIETENGAGS